MKHIRSISLAISIICLGVSTYIYYDTKSKLKRLQRMSEDLKVQEYRIREQIRQRWLTPTTGGTGLVTLSPASDTILNFGASTGTISSGAFSWSDGDTMTMKSAPQLTPRGTGKAVLKKKNKKLWWEDVLDKAPKGDTIPQVRWINWDNDTVNKSFPYFVPPNDSFTTQAQQIMYRNDDGRYWMRTISKTDSTYILEDEQGTAALRTSNGKWYVFDKDRAMEILYKTDSATSFEKMFPQKDSTK